MVFCCAILIKASHVTGSTVVYMWSISNAWTVNRFYATDLKQMSNNDLFNTSSSSSDDDSVLERPPCLACDDCHVTYKFETNSSGKRGINANVTFCNMHERDFRAPPARTAHTPPPATLPTSTCRLVTSRRDPTSSTNLPTISQRNPVPSSATFGGNRPPTNDDALSAYQEVVRKVLSCPDGSLAIKKAVSELNMNWRTFRRKRSIAEAMIIDPIEFKKTQEELASVGNSRRINQEHLSRECEKILSRPENKRRRRMAVADGRCI